MTKQPLHSRRGFLSYCAWSVASLVSGCQSADKPQEDLDGFILEQMQRNHIPAVLAGNRLELSSGYKHPLSAGS